MQFGIIPILYCIVNEIYTDHPMCLDALLPVICLLIHPVVDEDLDMVSVNNRMVLFLGQ